MNRDCKIFFCFKRKKRKRVNIGKNLTGAKQTVRRDAGACFAGVIMVRHRRDRIIWRLLLFFNGVRKSLNLNGNNKFVVKKKQIGL